jgi:phosphodiesterase/alkaline phosphatase D-like protein
LSATSVGTSTAKLNGTVNDNGMLTAVTFEYGLTPCYGSSVAAAPATLNAGTGSTAVMADLTGLSCNTYYYYRVVAANSTATTTGDATLFQTAACP